MTHMDIYLSEFQPQPYAQPYDADGCVDDDIYDVVEKVMSELKRIYTSESSFIPSESAEFPEITDDEFYKIIGV